MTRTAPSSFSAFTDYPDGTMRQVALLGFDGNKYATVRHADGSEASVKRGYVYADAHTKRRVSAVHWHVLAGGQRHTYKRRRRKTTYRLLSSDGHGSQRRDYEALSFGTLQGALQQAHLSASEHGEDVFILADVVAHNSSTFGRRLIVMTPRGEAYEKRRRRHVKYLMGWGRR